VLGPGAENADKEEAFARFARLRRRLHPPPNEIPGILPVAQFLGRSAAVAAVLVEVHAYTVGLDFRLTYRARDRQALDHPPFIPIDSQIAKRFGKPSTSGRRASQTR
jgi:hypothetical protein